MVRVLALATLLLVACARSAAPHAADPYALAWDELVAQFIEENLADDPAFAVAQGRHDFDGRVADLSRSGIRWTVARLEYARVRVITFDPARLDRARRFEREALLARIDGQLFWTKRYRDFEKNPRLYAEAIDPGAYVTRDYAPLAQRMQAYIAHARQIPRVVAAMRANLVPPLPRPFVEVGSSLFRGLGPYIARDVPKLFAEVEDPLAQLELARVTSAAVLAIVSAVRFLDGLHASAHENFALGPALFREMLWATERVDTPLDELEAVARADLERNSYDITLACERVAPGASLEECVRRVNAEKIPEGPVAGAREQLAQLRRFLRAADLVSIPGEQEARVEPAPPHKRWNQAYIEIPGPFERGAPAIYYIAPPDPRWPEDDRLAYEPGRADLLFISMHEVWPGHFLQALHANRAERPFARLYVGYAFAEGWAHYGEELMWEAGAVGDDATAHVGQLLNALLRDVRFLSALGLHARGMTVAESAALFRAQALLDATSARREAVRGTFDPGYLNYTLGKLMIRKMRDDYVQARGGRAAYREFHDRLLSFGGPPLPLVRRALLGEGGSLF